MGKTNFTFVSRALRTLSLLMVFSLVGWQTVSAQITGLAATPTCEGGVTVVFAGCDGSSSIEIEDPDGNAVVSSSGGSGTSFAGDSFTPGTTYTVNVSCDGNSSETMFTAVNSAPTFVISNVDNPDCASTFDGAFDVTINDDCGASYNVSVGGTTFFNVPSGNTITFGGLNVGSYTPSISLASAGSCNFGGSFAVDCINGPLDTTVTLINGDGTAPTLTVEDASGATPPATQTSTPPEGACSTQRTWIVTAMDDCDVSDVSATITNPTPGVSPSAELVLIDNAPTRYALEINAGIGTNTITVTVTDSNDNESEQEFVIVVEDDSAPQINAPTVVNATIPSCETTTPVNWTVTATDDCDGQPILVRTSGPAPGAPLAAGSYTVTYEATDAGGNTTTSSFVVNVTQLGGGLGAISCVDVRVTLTADCVFDLTVQNVGAAQGLECITDELYVIIDDGTPNGNTVDGVGEFPYGIVDGSNDEMICWGTVTAEDKTPPTIVCPPMYEIECFLVDEVLNNSDSWNSRLNPGRLDSDGDPYYDADRPYPRGVIYTGFATGDDCYLVGGFDVSDQVQYFECAETGDGALYTGRISRRFTVRDAGGRTASCTQMINLRRVGVEDFMHVARNLVGNSANDFVNVGTTQSPKWEYTVNTCNADPTANPATVYPRYKGKDEVIPADKRVPNPFYGSGRASDGNRYDLDDVSCDLSTEVERHQFLNVCSDGSYKEEVSIKVFDWCQGMVDPGSVAFDYVVKVGDFSAPFEPSPGTCITPTSYQNEADVLDNATGLNGMATTASELAALEICGMVSTGPMNCTAAMNVSLAALESRFGNLVDDCSDDLSVSVEVYSYLPVLIGKIPTGDSAWVKGDYQRQGDMVMGLPEGLHVLFLNISDRCYNTANFLLYFRVMDLVKPVMKCDDELRVTLVEGDAKLGINGYALATAAEVDEGSWDNCELVDLHVRRSFLNDATGDARADWIAKNDPAGDDLLTDEFGSRNNGDDYTPWRDIVEFFCADVATDGVKVELRGTDRKGNQSICWLDVDVENGTNFEVILSGGNREIDCTAIPANIEDIDEAFMASLGIRADIVSVTSCNTGSAGLLINTGGLNQCGIGTITVSIDPASISELESKNNVVYNPNARRTITVVGDHDYWVKFPKDEDYFCEDAPDTDVDYGTNSCDLITVYQDDERFEAVADPDACYKIFRTYKVINWCEYDGESLPVIVSRDWDAHNATNCSTNWDNGIAENPDYTDDAGEYNLNPIEPDGDGVPGNTDMYVIVDINNRDLAPIDYNGNGIRASEGELDIVYYDNDNDPYNTSTANKYGDTDVNFANRFNNWGGVYNPNQYRYDEGYWWAVIRGTSNCDNGESAWFDDESFNDGNSLSGTTADIDGTDNQDDEDNRYGSFGYWQYTQHLVVYDDSDPELIVDIDEESLCSIDGEGCDANVEFTATVTDACSTAFFTVTYNVNGGTETAMTDDDGDGTYDATFPDAPLGKHILTVTVTDGCGNVADYTEEFEVVDCKGPAPICHDGIVVELMPTEDGAGMAEVWASDLIASPINDCTALSNDAAGLGEVPVEAYSIFLNEGFVDYATAAADADDQTGLFFTCTDAGTEPMVRVYAEDKAGNVDYCLTFVRVQDNNSICAPAAGGSIAGAVATETAANVEGVEVQLSGARSMMYMTDASGSFGFDGLAQGGDYTVTPQKDLNHLNGVSTFDLVLISKHILGVSQLDSPYKMIAADVNNSQSITTLDLIQLRKLILNIDTEFANNTSWRFIDKSHVFADPSNPWSAPIPEFKNINNLVDNAEAEFVATKIGDVNGSATVEARAATGDFAINTAEQAMIAGNEYTIDFSADMNDIAGYQFTLDVANAEIVDVIYGAAKAENFGVFTKEGVITTSFNGEAAGTLFSVVVRATADTKVSEAIQISSRYTAAEAYTNDAEQLNVNLNVAGATAAEAAFALEQNTPNPFQGETLIGFNLPEAQEATITLQDVAGRTVKMIEGDFTKGYNQVTISANDLPSAGVYFYTLTAGDKSATKKLILVDAVNR